MARAGLGSDWKCLFANDFDPKKAATYAQNWGEDALVIGDVGALTAAQLPGRADLAWGSFPCQDLSLAGVGAGLNGERSGAFWPFWQLMQQLGREGRPPSIIVLENVCGALTSHGGRDFAAIASALADEDYLFGALTIDAAQFVPQSRPRLFIVAAQSELAIPREIARSHGSETLLSDVDPQQWHSQTLVKAQALLPKTLRAKWLWWCLPAPPKRNLTLEGVIERAPKGVEWHDNAQTQRLFDLMSPAHRAKVEAASSMKRPVVGTLYKRTRIDGEGRRRQRAEVRFDNIAGCLRTPLGGSSRQTVLIVDGDTVRSRLLSPREAARLMGLPDDYDLPENYNQACHLAGDGVVVPVVGHLARHIIEPVLDANRNANQQAA
jgi:DNA (cytosine-5)-methyltransferase 1